MLNMEGLGSRLREERERIGHNQTVFADLAGSSRRTQAAYEAGSGSPNVDYLSAISDAGADVLYILTGHPSGSVSAAESELLRLYRAAPQQLRDAALRVLGGTPGAGTTAPVVHGDVSQVVHGDAIADTMTFRVGGRSGEKRGGRQVTFSVNIGQFVAGDVIANTVFNRHSALSNGANGRNGHHRRG